MYAANMPFSRSCLSSVVCATLLVAQKYAWSNLTTNHDRRDETREDLEKLCCSCSYWRSPPPRSQHGVCNRCDVDTLGTRGGVL